MELIAIIIRFPSCVGGSEEGNWKQVFPTPLPEGLPSWLLG